MLRYVNYNIVFQEVPGEVSLAVNLSNCPHTCEGCHSPHLREDRGSVLDENALTGLLQKYGQAITCMCFMGGDAAPQEVVAAAAFLKQQSGGRLKIAWYSGRTHFPKECSLQHFDYVKLGPYIKSLGGIREQTSNQRFYRVENGKLLDITEVFWR